MEAGRRGPPREGGGKGARVEKPRQGLRGSNVTGREGGGREGGGYVMRTHSLDVHRVMRAQQVYVRVLRI